LVQGEAGAMIGPARLAREGASMSKYERLSEHLIAWPEAEWRASFAELESVLGGPLPKPARRGRAWWTNDPDKRHARAWAAHGWAVSDVDHAAGRVVFRRGAAPASEIQPPALRKAAETAAARQVSPLGAAIVTGGLALMAGVAALAVRGMRKRPEGEPARE
jgi:hypothetical protein